MHIEEVKALGQEIHEIAVSKGWWDEENRNEKEIFMLINTELSEAVEADREGRHADKELFEEKYNLLKEEGDLDVDQAYWAAFRSEVKDTVEDELADAYIRCLDWLWHTYGSGIVQAFTSRYVRGGLFTDNFAESIFTICKYVCEEDIGFATFAISSFAIKKEIDLEWHVKAKIKYNKMRPEKHGGKKY